MNANNNNTPLRGDYVHFEICKAESGAEYIRVGKTVIFLHNHEDYVDRRGRLEVKPVFEACYWVSNTGRINLDFGTVGLIAVLPAGGKIYATEPDQLIAKGDYALVDVMECCAFAALNPDQYVLVDGMGDVFIKSGNPLDWANLNGVTLYEL